MQLCNVYLYKIFEILNIY